MIVDGEINKFGMKCIEMSEKELCERLKSKSVEKKSVFLYTVDDVGNENWIFKNENGLSE